jgi:hypothetical protein
MKFHDTKNGMRVKLTKRVLYSLDDKTFDEIYVEAGTAGVIKNRWIDDDCSVTVALDDGRLISIIEHELDELEPESAPQPAL